MLVMNFYSAPLEKEISYIDAFSKLTEAVKGIAESVIGPTRNIQETILGISTGILSSEIRSGRRYGSSAQLVSGELYTDGKDIYAITIESFSVPQNEDEFEEKVTIEFFHIGPNVAPEALDFVVKNVNEIFGICLKKSTYNSSRFSELREEGRSPPTPPLPAEVEAARLLSDRSIRNLLTAVKTSGGLLVSDLPKQLATGNREKIERMHNELQENGLLEADTVIVCAKNQLQIARAPSKAHIAEMSRLGMRCACGRPIAEERIEEAVTITDIGRRLLDGSFWLTILVLDELQAIGIPIENILIEQQFGGDEVDCLANISGELVFFELKDKDFNLGNAYSFGAKMGIVRPNHSVIVCTQRVGGDAKDHFSRAQLANKPHFRYGPQIRQNDVRYIEGIENLREGMRDLATIIYRADARGILEKVLRLAPVGAQSVLASLEGVTKEDIERGEYVLIVDDWDQDIPF